MALRRVGRFVLEPKDLHVFREGSGKTAPRVGPQVAAKAAGTQLPRFAVLAVAAGPMFGRTGSKRCGGGSTACTRQLDVTLGVDEPGCRCTQQDGLTFSVVANTLFARRYAEVAFGARVAVQLYPTLVWEGEPSRSKQVLSSVAGLGVRRDGKLVSLVAGRATLGALAAAFVAEGCYAAGYTDAGPSAALWLPSGTGIYLGAHGANPKLPTWLVFTGGAPVP